MASVSRVTAVPALLAILLGLSACSDARGNFPAEIELEDELLSNAEAVFIEGCLISVFRLSDRASARVQEEGALFLDRLKPRDDTAPVLGRWLATPVQGTSYGASDRLRELGAATFAIAGCGEDNPFDRAVERALVRPGSYFSRTPNGEGLMVIAPKDNLAAFMYVG